MLAAALEERGYTSLFIGEHSHIPASRRTPYPAGGEMPDAYRRMMDPFVSLTMAAAATERLQLGTRRVPRPRAPRARPRQVGRHARRAVGRARPVRRRCRLERRGAGQPSARHRLEPALPSGRGMRRGAAAVLDRRRRGVPRRVLRLRSGVVVPEAAAAPHPPVLLGTGGRLGTRHAVRWADEWMPMDVALGDVAKKIGQVPRGGGGGRAGDPDLARHVSATRHPRRSTTIASSASCGRSSAAPGPAGTTRTRRCRSSTATPP